MVLQLYHNRLAIEASYIINEGILSKDNYKQMCVRKRLLLLRRACRNTPALLDYESMPSRFKKEILKRIPDPYRAIHKNEIEKFIEQNIPLSDNLERYLVDEGRHLKPDTIREYYSNGIIFDAIKEMRTSNKGHHGKISWKYISNAIRDLDRTIYPHSLPENERRLEDKYRKYQKEGWTSLIHGNFRNKNAAIVDSKQKESAIIGLLRLGQNSDDVQIMNNYNVFAEEFNWEKITSPATIAKYREKYYMETYADRHGVNAFDNKINMQAKRKAPTYPLYFWTLDGWDAELLYQKKNEKGITTYYNRVSIVMVLDACGKYPIGFAIGDHECPELIKEALRSAERHCKEIFGTMYQTQQIQMDRYAIKKLMPFYSEIGVRVTPARHHNAKSKIIEPFFHYFEKKYCQKINVINWSGFGVTSKKELQPNMDQLNAKKKDFPDYKGLCHQLGSFIFQERCEKIDEYYRLFTEMPSEHKVVLDESKYLLKLGTVTGNRNLMQPSGLYITINGQKRIYDCFDINFRKHLSVRWEIRYEESDLSRVLAVNEDGSLQFLLEEKYVQPMALIERKPGDFEQLKRVFDYKEKLKNYINNFKKENGDNLQELYELSKLNKLEAGDDDSLMPKDPELDVLNKFLLTDSKGQHKDERSKMRMTINEASEEEFFTDKY